VQDIQVQLSPGVFRDGRQWLSVTVSNNSAGRIVELEPGGLPPEILVDGVAYRSTRTFTPAERRGLGGRRVNKPGTRNYGGEFTLDETWITVDGTKRLQLKPGNHTVQAILYAADKDAEDRGRKVLSNAVKIGVDGRAVGSRNVRIRILGGAEKKPLEGIELTVTPSGRKESVTATTQEDGGASFKLLPGSFRLGLIAAEELPYLPISRTEAGSYQSGISVADTPGNQQIEYRLADACQMILRAVDAGTGRGVAGVVFATENAEGEYWAQPIRTDTLGPPKSRRGRIGLKHESLRTDEQGYFRRHLGSRPGWTYFIWSTPPDFESVRPGEQVKVATPPGKRKAEHTFLVRRTKATADEP